MTITEYEHELSHVVTSSGDPYVQDSSGLWYLRGYEQLTPEAKSEICNGIGAATGITKYFPNTIYLLDCREAGNRHDYSYYRGGDANDRRYADMFFLLNLCTLINQGSWFLRIPRHSRARKYWLALRLGGWAHFTYQRSYADNDSQLDRPSALGADLDYERTKELATAIHQG